RGLTREEVEEGAQARAHAPGEGGLALDGLDDAPEELLDHRVVRGEKRLLLVLEVLVEGPARDAGDTDDALDRHLAVAGRARHVGHGGEDALALVLRNEAARQAMTAWRQLVRFAPSRAVRTGHSVRKHSCLGGRETRLFF